MRQPSRFWLLVGLLLWLGWHGLAGPQPVLAHALLVRSIPEANAELLQPPPQIDLWFSEPLEDGFNQVRLLTATGQEILLGPVVLDPADPTHLTISLEPLEAGIYTIAWQNLSRADGHEWAGSFPFTILNPDGSRPTGPALAATAGERSELPTFDEILARWLGLLGGMLFLGASVFWLLLGPDTELTRAGGLPSFFRNLALRAVWLAALVMVLSGWLQLSLQAIQLGGLERLPDLLLATRTGTLVLVRQVLALTGLLIMLSAPQPYPLQGKEWRFYVQLMAATAAVILTLLLTITQTGWGWLPVAFGVVGGGVVMAILASRRNLERRQWQTLAGLAAALLLTFSLGSHARGIPGSGWAVLVDYVHLLAAAIWVGGLLLLPVLGRQIYRAASGGESFLRAVRRFSYLAGFLVFVLATTGLFSSLVQLPTPGSLLQTAYGRILLLKLLLVALVLPVAFLNNRLIHRRAVVDGQAQRFNRLVMVEAIISLGILVSVAILAQTTAPRSLVLSNEAFEPAQPYNEIIKADDLNIHLQIMPGKVGQNTFIVHLYHDDNSPVGQVQLVRLFFDYREAELGRALADLQGSSQDNIFNINGAYLNQSGWWDISVYVRRRGMDDLLAEYRMEVLSSGSSIDSTGPWQNPIPTLPSQAAIAGGLVALGVVPIIWKRPIRKAHPRILLIANLIGGLLVVLGLIIIAGWVTGLMI